MDALLYARFASADQLQTCLYYFDPATSLPFADEVEPHVDVEVNIECI